MPWRRIATVLASGNSGMTIGTAAIGLPAISDQGSTATKMTATAPGRHSSCRRTVSSPGIAD
jgi:hypothetical protein